MKTNTDPKDLAEATETVHRFLRMCFLSRIKSEKGGGYTVKNTVIITALFGVILQTLDLCMLFVGRREIYDGLLYGIIEVCETICSFIALTITLYKVSYEDEIKTTKTIDNMSAIDKALGAHRPNTYRIDRTTINIYFFAILAIRTIVVTCSGLGYVSSFGIRKCAPFFSQFLIQLVLDANYVYNICKLKLFNHRMLEMKHTIQEFCKDPKRDPEHESDNEIDHHKMKSCYLKLYEICLLFNESQGLQILLEYTRLIIGTITTISSVTTERSIISIFVVLGNLSYLFVDIGMLVALLVQASTILQISNDVSLVVERALVKKYFGSERESAAWEEFVELVHRCPLVLTAYDFFTLDYSLLGATFGTMVTYTIILTQLNP